ncbi:MAG: exosortase [Phycisphaerae bacterium]|nr:exosortase [Phycisphaerae bacterium]
MKKKQIKIKAIILAGTRDFGRCPIASKMPLAMWPLVDKPIVEKLLTRLTENGIEDTYICCNGDSSMLQKSLSEVYGMNVKFLDEPFPAGTAGCIRDAANGDTESLYLLIHATFLPCFDIAKIIIQHKNDVAELSVVLAENTAESWQTVMHVCEPTVLDFIPAVGYFDIKEGLIPAMVRHGRTVRAQRLSEKFISFHDRDSYIRSLDKYLQTAEFPQSFGDDFVRDNSVIRAKSAYIAPTARIFGKVVLRDNVRIEDDAVLFGSCVIGNNSCVGKGSIVTGSIIWDNVKIGDNCCIKNCVIANKAAIPDNSVFENQGITWAKQYFRMYTDIKKFAVRMEDQGVQKLHEFSRKPFPKHVAIISAILLLAAFLWSYLPSIQELSQIWMKSDEYSSGLLVPFLGVYVLWTRRSKFSDAQIKPSLYGLFILALAEAMRHFGLFFMYGSAQRLSLVVAIFGFVLLLFGTKIFAKVFTILIFLFLMIPPPNRVHAAVTLPLQELATRSAVFCHEMLGMQVFREGNVIHLNGSAVAIAEACNGLRMATAFLVIAAWVTLLASRPWWQKGLVFLSALPIALVCNTIRLALTAIAFTRISGPRWETLFHDFGGYAMMPLALGMIFFEIWLFDRLTVERKDAKPQIIYRTLSMNS